MVEAVVDDVAEVGAVGAVAVDDRVPPAHRPDVETRRVEVLARGVPDDVETREARSPGYVHGNAETGQAQPVDVVVVLVGPVRISPCEHGPTRSRMSTPVRLDRYTVSHSAGKATSPTNKITRASPQLGAAHKGACHSDPKRAGG